LNGYKNVCCREILQNINMLSALRSPAAKAGHANAQYNLGWMFENGKGVEANPVKAVKWYRKGILSQTLQNINIFSVLLSPAAQAGNTCAQCNLGCMMSNGKGVKANPAKAVEWYQKGMLSQIV
jgi:uncharacterized protein